MEQFFTTKVFILFRIFNTFIFHSLLLKALFTQARKYFLLLVTFSFFCYILNGCDS